MILREEEFLNLDQKPKLLLHACCAPCASYVIDYLKDKFDITIFFYNPNIMPKEEHEKRYEEVLKLADIYNVQVIKGEYDNNNYLDIVKGKEEDAEGTSRCSLCYEMRLIKTNELAINYDYFATTLTVSPYKNTPRINEIGSSLSDKYLVSDFKKNDGYKKSIELSKKYNLYRQNYCGCIFSKRV